MDSPARSSTLLLVGALWSCAPAEAPELASVAEEAVSTVAFSPEQASDVIDMVDHATSAELDGVPNISRATAERIVRARPFGGDPSPIQRLDRVSGIGPAALRALRDNVDASWCALDDGRQRCGRSQAAAGRGLRVTRADSVAKVPSNPPAPGSYRVHTIDVGSGLAILVQGHDFNMLFDGGSSDDMRGISSSGNNSRLLAYLYAALGPSGPAECTPAGNPWPEHGDFQIVIDHVFLSHAHEDHNNMLDEVLRCYDVKNVWDSGAVNDTAAQRDFLAAVATEPGVRYHTAAPRPQNRVVQVFGRAISFPASIPWTSFAAGDRASLGDGARFKVLHADGTYYPNQFNNNSTVLRVELGDTSLLLTADAESGLRAEPSAPLGEIEAYLVERYAADLQVDVLQVGHHGSLTSSRRQFLDAVSPRYALVSAGPTINNGGVVFPEQATIDSLSNKHIQTLRTDAHDSDCTAADRVGVDDTRPGGCDNYVLEMD